MLFQISMMPFTNNTNKSKLFYLVEICKCDVPSYSYQYEYSIARFQCIEKYYCESNNKRNDIGHVRRWKCFNAGHYKFDFKKNVIKWKTVHNKRKREEK